MIYQITVDIGGTQIRAARFANNSDKPEKIERIATHGDGKPIDRLCSLVEMVFPIDGEVQTIAVAAPGPVDPYKGVIHTAPNITGWVDVPLKSHIQDKFGIEVRIGNDANMAALGEWKYGAGRGHHHLVYLTISTGIGGGVIIDDRLLLGKNGLATELGHITIDPDGPLCSCGQRGHLEAFSSGTAIARWVKEEIQKGAISSLSSSSTLTTREISKAAREGDNLAIKAFEFAGTHLGHALADFLHIFNPSIIILGGGVINSGELLLKPMITAMRNHVISPHYLDNLTISPASLGDDSGLMGALVLARSSEQPCP